MTFDDLWAQEERQGLLSRLRNDYPGWKRRHNRRCMVAAVAVATVGILLTFPFPIYPSRSYDYVCCNRSGIAESHWVDVTHNILTIETL